MFAARVPILAASTVVVFLALCVAGIHGLPLASDLPDNLRSIGNLDTTAAGAFGRGLVAFMYGLPIVHMWQSREKYVAQSGGQLNVFIHQRQLTNASGPAIFVSPNADTLYSQAWIDLHTGPVRLSVPATDTADRYYVLELLDFYTNNFADVGTRATGTAAGEYLLTANNTANEQWLAVNRDALDSASVTIIACPTADVWIVGRTLVNLNDPTDLETVWKFQDKLLITPSDSANRSWRKPDALFTADPTPPKGLAFFELVGQYIKADAPPASDALFFAFFGAIGLTVSGGFNASVLTPEDSLALSLAGTAGYSLIHSADLLSGHFTKSNNGWRYIHHVGTYGINFLVRAVVSDKYLAANIPEEAMYFTRDHDSENRPLSGAENARYSVKFPGGIRSAIPCKAFWSITMYNATNYFLVDNEINRYAIGDRTAGLYEDPADGSLTVYIQADVPTDAHELSNWLPAPREGFYMLLRAYVPSSDVVSGVFQLPELVKVA
eukprot:Opistho-2@71376